MLKINNVGSRAHFQRTQVRWSCWPLSRCCGCSFFLASPFFISEKYVSRALYTSPLPPAPIGARISYGPSNSRHLDTQLSRASKPCSDERVQIQRNRV